MDQVRFKVLQAELKNQLDKIEKVHNTLEERAAQAGPEAPPNVESEAYQLHNLYNAIEDLLKIVAQAFENSVSDFSRWHTQLIDRLTLDIDGVRPALLENDTASLLQELRAFRHFFRHAYGVPLDFDRVEKNLEKARQVLPLLHRDVERFLKSLEETEVD